MNENDEREGRVAGEKLRDAAGWGERYTSGDTPWDTGDPHPEVLRRIGTGELAPAGDGRAYVPGCGRGHDALALARAGWSVAAVDFAPGLEAELQPALAALGGSFECADALAWDGGPVDLVFEHTFHCALPPSEHDRWVQLMHRVLRPGGILAVLLFPANKPAEDGGPPYRTVADELAERLGVGFALENHEDVELPLERRNWLERWAVLRRWPHRAD